MRNKENKLILVLCFVSSMIYGCKNPLDELQEIPSNAGKKSKAEYLPSASAGIQKDLAKTQDEKKLKVLIAATSGYGRRSNPFAMSLAEIAFDNAQASERFLQEDGDMGTKFETPEDTLPSVVSVEPQPYRRLSGIVIGEAVYGLLEENGRTYIIRPGMMLPDSSWKVVSIDKEKAQISRDGSLLPKQLEIRLESPPPGIGGSGNQQRGPVGGGESTGGPAGGGRGRSGSGAAGRGAD